MPGIWVLAGAVEFLTSNTHGKSQEMAMTAAFVTGPLGAAAGALLGLFAASWPRG
ncbi:MAG TPA: hypothetical protein PKD49_12305 [Hyphomicrobium sp.]|nr:hypothetical protein [Hyphomicrobium sp.]